MCVSSRGATGAARPGFRSVAVAVVLTGCDSRAAASPATRRPRPSSTVPAAGSTELATGERQGPAHSAHNIGRGVF